jgi:hypothetical protein
MSPVRNAREIGSAIPSGHTDNLAVTRLQRLAGIRLAASPSLRAFGAQAPGCCQGIQ